jgi:hypothetical protein
MKLATGNLTAVMLGALMILTACAAVGPPLPPSLELPKPPSDLRASRKGDRVTLAWTVPSSTTDRQTIRSLGPTSICRGVDAKLAQCGAPVGQVAPASVKAAASASKQKATSTYMDMIPSGLLAEDPAAEITYAVEVANASGRSAGLSNEVHVPAVRTLPPPEKFEARLAGDGIRISWAMPPVLNPVHDRVTYRLRVYRRQDGTQAETKLAEIEYAGSTANATGMFLDQSFLDQSFTWEQTYFYHLAVVTAIVEAGKPEVTVEGDDSAEVKVFAHDVFPPAVPASLQAVFSGPGQKAFIDLIWAPVTDVDLEGYNVYRHEAGTAAVKVNAEPLKTPAFRDENVVSGKKYSYSVSAVDARGNESARSEEASESVP